MNRFGLILFAWMLLGAIPCRATTNTPSATVETPGVPREFRGAWIASVDNIDWPSRPGLTVTQQKQELIALLNEAARLNLNAIVFQVRPASDALYASKYEPWSYYLTGVIGRSPGYDPLEFAIEEAHRRGLELHAWFNPFRATLPPKVFAPSNHVSRSHPGMVVQYGKSLWLDPGKKEAQDYTLKVVMDVVERYDIDGVHFDDYFYPYPEMDSRKRELEFPDESSWRQYHGKLNRAEWRRQNVDTFIQRVYESIKAAKPWVKFGVAPFGIWQPGYPPQISRKTFNAYETLYCDSRKWLANGWLDYCSPQLYWAVDSPQSFPVLLNWWQNQNIKHRNLWPGINSRNVGVKWKGKEIADEIKIVREQCGANAGELHWGVKTILSDRGGLAKTLESVYTEPALIPASPWLDRKFPDRPEARLEGDVLRWFPALGEQANAWVLQTRDGGRWRTRILPRDTRQKSVDASTDLVVLRLIDRYGMSSPPVTIQRR